jgi:hypothetical protein
LFGSTKHLYRFGQLEFLGKFVCAFAKPISDPRESIMLFSGLHFLCPYLEVNRWVILRRCAVLSWLTPPFSYGRRTKVRQKYSEAVVADIRVAVVFGLSIWFFFLVISCFSFSGCFVRIQILDSEVRNVWVCVVLVEEAS